MSEMTSQPHEARQAGRGRDYFAGAERKALKYGIIDEIYRPRSMSNSRFQQWGDSVPG